VLDEIGGGAVVTAKGLPVLLMKRNGQIFALSNRCPHMGCTLGGGSMDGYILTCPCHDWRFDIRTGMMTPVDTGVVLQSYEWKIESGKISVKIRGD
jgi:nitrite reductase/ring-hydroxylating ferredoxin subunit